MQNETDHLAAVAHWKHPFTFHGHPRSLSGKRRARNRPRAPPGRGAGGRRADHPPGGARRAPGPLGGVRRRAPVSLLRVCCAWRLVLATNEESGNPARPPRACERAVSPRDSKGGLGPNCRFRALSAVRRQAASAWQGCSSSAPSLCPLAACAQAHSARRKRGTGRFEKVPSRSKQVSRRSEQVEAGLEQVRACLEHVRAMLGRCSRCSVQVAVMLAPGSPQAQGASGSEAEEEHLPGPSRAS